MMMNICILHYLHRFPLCYKCQLKRKNIINQNMLKSSKNARVKAFPQRNFLRAITTLTLLLSPVVDFSLSNTPGSLR